MNLSSKLDYADNCRAVRQGREELDGSVTIVTSTGETVWYILTDTTDKENAEALGLNFSAKLQYAASSGGAAVRTGRYVNENGETIRYGLSHKYGERQAPAFHEIIEPIMAPIQQAAWTLSKSGSNMLELLLFAISMAIRISMFLPVIHILKLTALGPTRIQPGPDAAQYPLNNHFI